MFEELLEIDGAVSVGVSLIDESGDEVGMHVNVVFGMREGAEFHGRQETIPVHVRVAELGLIL